MNSSIDPFAPLPLPNIHLKRASFFPGIVEEGASLRRKAKIMRTSSGSCYAWTEDDACSDCIYGKVRTGYVLINTNIRDRNGLPIFRCGEKRAMKEFYNYRIESFERRRGMRENWLQELKAISFVGDDHDYIMGNIEICCDMRNNVYSIMQYADGDDLFKVIRPDDQDDGIVDPLSDAEARRMMTHLLKALKYMHEDLRIVHQDISPENVLVKTGANALRIYMLHDMGQSMRLPDQVPNCNERVKVHRRPFLGKPYFRAPELWKETPIDPSELDLYVPEAADIWSLGCLLFAALVGMPPMESATESDARFNMIIAGQLETLVKKWKVQDLVSHRATDMIQQMLRYDPDERPTIDELLSHPWMQDPVIGVSP